MASDLPSARCDCGGVGVCPVCLREEIDLVADQRDRIADDADRYRRALEQIVANANIYNEDDVRTAQEALDA